MAVSLSALFALHRNRMRIMVGSTRAVCIFGASLAVFDLTGLSLRRDEGALASESYPAFSRISCVRVGGLQCVRSCGMWVMSVVSETLCIIR